MNAVTEIIVMLEKKLKEYELIKPKNLEEL